MELDELKKWGEQLVKDTAVHVKNNTEKTNSDLVGAIWVKLEKELEPAIKKHVNVQFDTFKEEFRDYVKEDIEWKKQAMPVIEMGKNVQGFGKVSLYIVGFVASVTGAIYAIINFIEKK